MNLTVIDGAPYKKGMLIPKDFLKLFGEVGPFYLGYLLWDAEFFRDVRAGEVDGASFEGVVGKGRTGKKDGKLVMRKIKTQRWIDSVLALYGEERGRKIINS